MEYHDLNSTLIEPEGRKPIKEYFTKKVLLVKNIFILKLDKIIITFIKKQNHHWIRNFVDTLAGFCCRKFLAIQRTDELNCSERKIRRAARTVDAQRHQNKSREQLDDRMSARVLPLPSRSRKTNLR